MLKKYEKKSLEAYLELPSRKLLSHKFELEEDYLSGYVTRFLHGERFNEEFIPFSEYELDVIHPFIESNLNNSDAQDLQIAFLLTNVVCVIRNKYKK